MYMAVTLKFRDPINVKEKIAMQGESIAGFSRRIKVNYSLMIEYLNGKKFPSPPTAKKIADGLSVKIIDIFFA
jgi:transcriptional regulator with XRE-family HTH domain